MEKKSSFGSRANIPDRVEESRAIPFVLSTFARDRHGTVLNQDNWKLDNYRKNPVVGYAHKIEGSPLLDPNPDFIIGKSNSTIIEGIGKDRKLTAVCEFEPADINPLAEKIFRKVLFGSLSRASVGFIEIGSGAYGINDEARGRSNETYYFNSQELLEWSIVNVASNPDAGKRKARTLEDEPLGTKLYVMQQLLNRYWPSYLEKLPIEDIQNLLEAKDLDIKETDPLKIRKMLQDPQAIADRIDNERRAFLIARKTTQQENETLKNAKSNNFKTPIIKKMKNFDLVSNVIAPIIARRDFDKETLTIQSSGIEAMRQAGLSHLPGKNTFCMPVMDRAIVESNLNTMDNLLFYGLQPAGEQTVFSQAGATLVTGINSNITVPSLTAASVSWKAQNESGEDAGISINSVTISPLRLTTFVDISKLLLTQSGPAASKYFTDSIIGATAAKLEETILGVDARSAYQPQGMGYKITTGDVSNKASIVPTFSNILEMEAEIAALKALQGNLAYITSGKGKRILKTSKKEVGTPESLLERGLMNDYPVFISNYASDASGSGADGSLLMFGNWADLIICQFGTYMITVDQFSLAKYNIVRILVDSFFDVKGMRFPSAVTGVGTQNDEYAGFASIAMKLS